MLSLSAIKTHLWHWKQALMGPVMTISLLIYQQATGKPLTWGWFMALIFGALAWQFYSDNKNTKEEAADKSPKLFLHHVDRRRNNLPNFAGELSGFSVQVEGPKKAFAVRITSPDSVGKEHTRVSMDWGSINMPVGNDPVPVSVLCSAHKGAARHTQTGPQIEAFRDFTNRADLFATIQFKDVDGNECPPRKFKIYRERDLGGEMKTHCDLIKD